MKPECAKPMDLQQIKQLLIACELPSEDISSALLQHFFTVRDEAQLIGVVGLEVLGENALLRSLAVAEPHRGRGIATQLTEQAEEYARSKGIHILYLLTTTAAAFFAKRGYKETDRTTVPAEVARTTEFRSLCPASAVCMVKHLAP